MFNSSRIALITGANRGIGRSTALALARDGIDIIITYRSHADEAAAVVTEITSLGRKAVPCSSIPARPTPSTRS